MLPYARNPPYCLFYVCIVVSQTCAHSWISALTRPFGVSIQHFYLFPASFISSTHPCRTTRSHHVVVCCSSGGCDEWPYCACCIPVLPCSCLRLSTTVAAPVLLLLLTLLGRRCCICRCGFLPRRYVQMCKACVTQTELRPTEATSTAFSDIFLSVPLNSRLL